MAAGRVHAEFLPDIAHVEGRIAALEAELATARGRLNERQRRFCEACGGRPPWGRAYRAAQAAGYASPRSQGSRLVSMPKVRAVLALTDALWLARRDRRQLQAWHAEL